MKLFVVDGNFYLHRVYSIVSQREMKPWSVAHAFIAKVCVDALAVRANAVLVTFDGDNIFRYRLFKSYKAQRAPNDEVYSHLPRVLKALKTACIPCVQDPEYEGDDLMCGLARKYDGSSHTLIIGGRDKDLYQFMRPNVVLYDSTFKPEPRYIRYADVERLTGMPPELHVSYQALVGDGVDNIPKVVTPAKAKAAMLKYRSVRAWEASGDKVFTAAERKQLKMNHKLVRLVPVAVDWEPAPIVVDMATVENMPPSYFRMLGMMKPRKSLFG